MNRQDFQILTEIRLAEAKVLLDAGHWPGAFYLCGYAVECALKSCIAKLTNQYDFPPNKDVIGKIYVHNPEVLLEPAGLKAELIRDVKADKDLEKNWKVVLDWTEAARYEASVAEADARNLYSAITDGRAGVLTWLKKRW